MWYSEEMTELNNNDKKYRSCLHNCWKQEDVNTDIYNILIESREMQQEQKKEEIKKKYNVK